MYLLALYNFIFNLKFSNAIQPSISRITTQFLNNGVAEDSAINFCKQCNFQESNPCIGLAILKQTIHITQISLQFFHFQSTVGVGQSPDIFSNFFIHQVHTKLVKKFGMFTFLHPSSKNGEKKAFQNMYKSLALYAYTFQYLVHTQ